MKNKSNRLFHTGLYVESLRQARMMGLVYLLICLIFAVLPPLLGAASQMYPTKAQEHAVVLYFYDFIAPLTMGYAVFGYLTRRNASDFYHALPVTREAAFFSRAAAVMTYQVITIAATVLVSLLTFRMAGSMVHFGHLPLLISYHTAASALVLSCTLIGLAAAGTYFSSFIVTGVVLFLPQLVLYVIYMMIDATAPTVYPETLSFLMDMALNLPVGMIVYLFTGGGSGLVNDVAAYILYFPAHLYTLALAVIALLIGCVIHNRRRSEIARSAAPNRVLQHLYRCLISLPMFLMIGTKIAMQESWSADSESYILLTVVGLLVYYLYELITTRKWKNLWGATKVLPLVLIAALVLPWLGFGIGHAVDDNVPARDKIESISLDVDQKHSTNPNYEMIALSRYEYTDDELIDLLHEALTMTVEYYDRYGGRGWEAVTVPMEMTPDSLYNVYESKGFRTLDVEFHLKGGKSTVRNIRLTVEQFNKLNALQTADEGFHSIIADLPASEQLAGLRAAGHMVPEEATHYSDITQKMIWNTFCEEYAALKPAEQLVLSNHGNRVEYTYAEPLPVAVENASAMYIAENEFGYSYYDSGNTLQVTGFEGLRTFYNSYKVTSLTPRTLVMMMQYVNDMASDNTATLPMLTQELKKITEDESVNFYMQLRLFDPKQANNGIVDLSRTILSEEQMADPEMAEEIARDLAYSKVPNYVGHEYLETIEKVMEILARGNTEIRDLNSPIVLMEHVSWDSYKSYMGYGSESMFYQLSDEDFAELITILEPYRAEE